MRAHIDLGEPAPDGLPSIAVETVRDVLLRLQCGVSAPGSEALQGIFGAWLRGSPFHNLDLLAGIDGAEPPLSAEAAVRHALSGHGGPCHVQAAGFASLLRALGYEVMLLPATVTERDDHLVVGVVLGTARFVCDVGNGHPYPGPFDYDRPGETSALGWRFSTTPSDQGLTLHRVSPDGDRRRVYVARWEPCRYADFARIIAAHHRSEGFGPFMTGLRAVRHTDGAMLVLRDHRYERHTNFGVSVRPVLTPEACRALLAGPFGLGHAPIERALRGLAQRRDIFAGIPSAHTPEGGRTNTPDVVFAVSSTDRPSSLRRLLRSLEVALRLDPSCIEAGGARVSVLVAENSTRPEHRAQNLETVAEASAAGIVIELFDDGIHGRSIARSRVRQTELIAGLAARRGPPAVVWMIDDDLAFATVTQRDGVEVTDASQHLISRVLRLRAEHPEFSAAVGPVTGHAQVRPEALLRVQTLDLLENLRWAASLDPAEAWRVPDDERVRSMPDYYYDHSRAGTEHLEIPCLWVPRGRVGTVRGELLAYLRACQAIPSGAHPTRALLEREVDAPTVIERPLRGGNFVFFDLDACLSHPYPFADLGRVHTRRSDMIGSCLLVRAGYPVATLPITLQHARDEALTASPDRDDRWRSLRSEFHGVLLARMVMDGVPEGAEPRPHLHALARRRASEVAEALRFAHAQLSRVDTYLTREDGWIARDPELRDTLIATRDTLRRMWSECVGGDERLDLDARLSALHDRLLSEDDLDSVLAAWRASPDAVRRMRDHIHQQCGGAT
jgi:arylamine N-acetyltransferase